LKKEKKVFIEENVYLKQKEIADLGKENLVIMEGNDPEQKHNKSFFQNQDYEIAR